MELSVSQKFSEVFDSLVSLFQPQPTARVQVLVFHPTNDGRILLVSGDGGVNWDLPSFNYNPRKKSPQAAAVNGVHEKYGLEMLNILFIGEYQPPDAEKKLRSMMFTGSVLPCRPKPADAEEKRRWQMYDTLCGRTDISWPAIHAANAVTPK